ncbi:MAG: low molecular weight phosphotyrosine protein phosphatase [Muribaculaceae bacterium]|nr:low molecular weight phosphotyrosine protein phosphatase [Muribaculaceae bacterium]
MDKNIIDNTARRLQGNEKIKILFVCLGNICRSPAAEGVFRAIAEENSMSGRFIADSAGTGGYHIGDLPDQRMRIHARRRGIELTHICRQVSESDFDEFDLIIGMDHNNLSNLHRIAPTPEAEQKIAPMAAWVDSALRFDHIPDPYYDGAEGFENVLDLLQNGCTNLFNSLK